MSNRETKRSLESLVSATPDLVDHLYNAPSGPHTRNNASLSPIPEEFSNWRDEQRAWRESAVLFDQSHHMPELILRGSEARRLLSEVGVNSLANLEPGRAKQFVATNPHGHVIGDCVLYDLGGETYELVSGMPLLNWVEYRARTSGYDVGVERDNNTSDNPTGRRLRFRCQLDGPNAARIFDRVVEGSAPDLGFFRAATVTIAGVEVLALRHGMAGHKGVELSGPYDEREAVLAALLAAGAEHGLTRAGTRAYFTTVYESGWMPYPLPGVYTGDDMRAYREWLPDDGWESRFQLSGSFRPASIEDYYVTPFDLGYGHIVKFDHDFTGRAALEEIAQQPPRKKVTLVWDRADVLRIHDSYLQPGTPYKYLNMPIGEFGFVHRDEVRSAAGDLVGLSAYCGYSFNERKILCLAMLDVSHAVTGTEVEVVWGEPDGGSRKPNVERHRQTRVRATVAPAPFAGPVQRIQRTALLS